MKSAPGTYRVVLVPCGGYSQRITWRLVNSAGVGVCESCTAYITTQGAERGAIIALKGLTVALAASGKDLE